MIKKSAIPWSLLLTAGVLAAGCNGNAQATEPEAFQGIVELDERVLAFEVPGRVVAVEEERGKVIDAGNELASLDRTLEGIAKESREAELRAARAQLELLRAGARREEIRAADAELRAARAGAALLSRNLDRQRRLATQGATASAISDDLAGQLEQASARVQGLEERVRLLRDGARSQEVDAAEARVSALVSALRGNEERLLRHTLRAPVGGMILDVHVLAGEIVAPGTPVVTLADTAHPYVDVFVPQADLDQVRMGARASVRVDSLDEALAGRVEDIGRQAEFTPRFLFSERERPNLVFRVRVRVDDPEQKLHAGLPAFATIDPAAAP